MYDAVLLFAKALHDLDTSQQIDIQPLSCDAQDTWPHGYSLINYMKIVSIIGIGFNEYLMSMILFLYLSTEKQDELDAFVR